MTFVGAVDEVRQSDTEEREAGARYGVLCWGAPDEQHDGDDQKEQGGPVGPEP
jgi:hypothetical protein